MCFDIIKDMNIPYRTLFYHHRDLWYPCQLSKYSHRMTLNPHAPIYKPKNCSRFFAIYCPELLIEMDASTSQDVADPIVPAKCPKTSWDSTSPTVSEQLHLLTTQVDQIRIDSEQALEQTKLLIQTFPLANINHFQYLHAVQQQVAQFFVDLNTEKNGRLKLCTTIRQLEDELIQLRREVNEPSPSSLPFPFTVDPSFSAAFQDPCDLGNAQISKPSITITLKRASSTTTKSRLPDQQRKSPTQPTSGTLCSDLESRNKQLEEKITKQRTAAKQSYPFTGFNLLFSTTDFEPWSLETQTLSCGNKLH